MVSVVVIADRHRCLTALVSTDNIADQISFGTNITVTILVQAASAKSRPASNTPRVHGVSQTG